MKNNVFELINQLSIETVVDAMLATKGVQRTNHGNTECPNPQHTDKKPSFHIYTQTNSCYCFSCQFGGDVVETLRKYYNIGDLKQADNIKQLIEVARQYGLQYDDSTPQKQITYTKPEPTYFASKGIVHLPNFTTMRLKYVDVTNKAGLTAKFIEIPIFDVLTNQQVNFQRISVNKLKNGETTNYIKRFQTNDILDDSITTNHGAYIFKQRCFGNLSISDHIIICEGFATGYSIAFQTGMTVYCAMTLSNIEKVYLSLIDNAQTNFLKPQQLIIAFDNDNDKSEQAIKKRLQIIEKLKPNAIMPLVDGYDYNDAHQLGDGGVAIVSQIELINQQRSDRACNVWIDSREIQSKKDKASLDIISSIAQHEISLPDFNSVHADFLKAGLPIGDGIYTILDSIFKNQQFANPNWLFEGYLQTVGFVMNRSFYANFRWLDNVTKQDIATPKTFPNFYTVSIGNTADGKSTHMSKFIQLLNAIAGDTMLSTLTSDTSILEGLEANKNILLNLIDEGVEIFKKMRDTRSIYNSSISSLLRTLYSNVGGSYKKPYSKRSNGNKTENPNLVITDLFYNMWFNIPTSEFKANIFVEDFQNGFLNRLMYFINEEREIKYRINDIILSSDMINKLNSIYQHGFNKTPSSECFKIPVTQDASDYAKKLESYFETHARKIDGEDFRVGLYGRIFEKIIRVAMVLWFDRVHQHIEIANKQITSKISEMESTTRTIKAIKLDLPNEQGSLNLSDLQTATNFVFYNTKKTADFIAPTLSSSGFDAEINEFLKAYKRYLHKNHSYKTLDKAQKSRAYDGLTQAQIAGKQTGYVVNQRKFDEIVMWLENTGRLERRPAKTTDRPNDKRVLVRECHNRE